MLKKKEIYIILIIVLCFGSFLIFRNYFQDRTVSEKKLIVTSHGDVVLEVSLSEDLTEMIATEEGYNLIVIEGGKAFVREADCKNQVCVQSAAIAEIGETIACLPHELLLEIRGQ